MWERILPSECGRPLADGINFTFGRIRLVKSKKCQSDLRENYAACEKTGFRFLGFHAIRHLTASILVQNNIPMVQIQSILQHKKLSATEIYLHRISNLRQVDLLDENAHGCALYATKIKCGHDQSGQTRISRGKDGETRNS